MPRRAAKKKPEPPPPPEPTTRDKLNALREARSEVESEYDQKIKDLDDQMAPLEQEIQREMAARLIAALPTLLTLVPEHSRTSCSDEDAGNYDRGCTRCQLLNIEEWNASDYEVDISVSERTDDDAS